MTRAERIEEAAWAVLDRHDAGNTGLNDWDWFWANLRAALSAPREDAHAPGERYPCLCGRFVGAWFGGSYESIDGTVHGPKECAFPLDAPAPVGGSVAPTMTDLMVSPESIGPYLDANPPPPLRPKGCDRCGGTGACQCAKDFPGATPCGLPCAYCNGTGGGSGKTGGAPSGRLGGGAP
jgi:hypothetical protein